MRAAVYCRISQDKTGEGLGVTRQLEDCRALAEQLGWDVAAEHVFSDNDMSATSGKPRTQYRRMLAAIKAGEVQAIIAWHPDRLYRRLVDLEELIPVVESAGVAIRTVRAGDFDLATPTGRMIARILASVATGEVEVKADRWRRSVEQRRKAGALPQSANRLFGYDREGRVVDEEAAAIRQVVDELIDGVSVTEVCRRLEAAGVRTTRGNVWQPGVIRNLVTNPRLAGFSVLNGEIVGVGSWTPILDAETFETVRAVLASRKAGPRKARVALLLGLAHCGRCGGRLVTGGRPPHHAGGPRVRTYRCATIPGRPGCGLVVSAEPVEELVESFARRRFSDPRVHQRIAELQASDGSAEAAAEAASLEVRVSELEAQLEEPGVPVATLLKALSRTKERLAELQVQLAAQVDVVTAPPRGGEWPADLQRRRRLVDVFIARVVIAPSSGSIGPRFDPTRVTIEERWA